MKKRIFLGVVFVCTILMAIGCSSGEMNSVNTQSSEIDGQWISTVEGVDGKELKLTYIFKADGTELFGTIDSRLGGGAISDGKIDGKNITFKLDAGAFTIINDGVLSDDEIQLTQTIGKQKINIVLKRGTHDE